MSTVQEIKSAIEQLPLEERAALNEDEGNAYRSRKNATRVDPTV